jgi:TRAP-type C4-dicarboxylate transport system permease small subunit
MIPIRTGEDETDQGLLLNGEGNSSMVKILDRVCTALAVVAGALILFMTFSISYFILTRATGVPSPIWVVQFNEYSMLWIAFLGTAWLLGKDRHISIQIVTSRLSERGKRIFRAIQDVAGFLVCLGFCYYCSFSTWDYFVRNIIDVQAVDVPRAYVVSVIPFGFLLMALQFIRRLVEDIRWLQDRTQEGQIRMG